MLDFGCSECRYQDNCPAFSHTGKMYKTGICPYKKPKEENGDIEDDAFMRDLYDF